MRRWDGLLDQYIAKCETRGLATTTLKSRRSELERWGAWLKRRRPKPSLEDVGAEMAIDYLKSRSAFLGKAAICRVVTEMRGMSEYLVEAGFWTRNPMRWIRGPKLDWRRRIPKRVGREHLQKLFEAAAESQQEYRRYLWTAVLSIFYGTGIRRGELSRLKLCDWDREQGLLRVDGRKTGLEHRVPVPRSVWGCIEAYLPRRQNMLERCSCLEEDALFVNGLGGRLTGQAIGIGVHRLAHRAGVPLKTVHQFRHTCASDLLAEGIPLSDIQQILGHATISSTVRYLEVADPQRREAMKRHPINELLWAGERIGQ